MSELKTMQTTDILTVSADTLVDINDVVVNKELSKKERISEFIKQIKNPYCFKCGDFIVKARYTNNGLTLIFLLNPQKRDRIKSGNELNI